MPLISVVGGLFVDSAERFFSYTETSDDISVVLDEKSVAEFPPHTLVCHPISSTIVFVVV
jgi:hypothetical protein